MTQSVNDILPFMPSAQKVVMHTGNIISRDAFKLNHNLLSTTDEITRSLTNTLKHWSEKINKTDLKDLNEIEISCPIHAEPIDKDDRPNLKLTAKIFLVMPSASYIEDAIDTTCRLLAVTDLETLIVSLPCIPSVNEDVEYSQYSNAWETIESLYDPENTTCDAETNPQVILNDIGIADMSKSSLMNLIENCRVNPTINQINLDHCCAPPEDVVEYCKEQSIQLLTHNDPPFSPDVLPQQRLVDTLQTLFTHSKDYEGWQIAWIVRYSTLVKCRGIIKSKGYILRLIKC